MNLNLMKFNRKTWLIIILCIVLGGAMSLLLYRLMERQIQPVKMVNVPVFNQFLKRGVILEKSHIGNINIPVNAVPETALMNTEDVIGKRLLVNVEKNEMIFNAKLGQRGVVKLDNVDIDKMYTIGINVENISDFLGLQIKVGEPYAFYAKVTEQEPRFICNAFVVSIIDTNANEISETSQTPIKTLNVAVENIKDVTNIIKYEQLKALEMIKAPKKNNN